MLWFCLILMLLGWGFLLPFSYLWVKKAIITMLLPNFPSLEKVWVYLDWANLNRNMLAYFWLGVIVIFFFVQIVVLVRMKGLKSRWLWVILGGIIILSSLSYSNFSDDVFSYLFAGRMIFYHGANPYWVMPNMYLGNDLWLGFMSNIDNAYFKLGERWVTYIYGPMFLGYSLIPFLIVGPVLFFKLFWSYKLLGGLIFLITGWLIKKIRPKDEMIWAYWFFNPFLIYELLVNGHNDLLMIFLWVLAYYWWSLGKKGWGFLTWILSVGTKYISGIMGVVFWVKDEVKRVLVFKTLGFLMMFGLAVFPRHSWYYTWVYMAFPFANLKKRTWFIFFCFQFLLLSNYFTYIYLNTWGGGNLFGNWVRWLFLGLMLLSEIKVGWFEEGKRNKSIRVRDFYRPI